MNKWVEESTGKKIITECIIDSQTIKIHNKGEEVGLGFTWVPCNGHKRINGRKRHIITGCDGHILKVKVHKANIHDTKGGVKVMGDAFWKYPSIKTIVANNGYMGYLLAI